MSEYRHVLWLDLETTGSDETRHEIIEIGCVLTTRNLTEVSRFSRVCRPERKGWKDHVDSVVDEMHETNGLWEDVSRFGEPVAMVEARVQGWLTESLKNRRQLALAGSGVSHFDRRFIARYMPRLARRLTYWSLDVGAVRRMFQRAGVEGPPFNGKSHRALEDAEQHLNEWRFYEQWISSNPAAAPRARG